MEIIELSREYDLTEIIFDYMTKGHYKAYMIDSEGKFSVEFVYEEFENEVSKSFSDILVPDYLEHPKSFAAKIDDQIVGYIVINHEKYNNRIRIAQFLVLNPHRGQGIGRALMNKAEEVAIELGARAMILETQSCNIPAIKFYHSFGFRFVGCDLACYSNTDIENHEVRLELGKPLIGDTLKSK